MADNDTVQLTDLEVIQQFSLAVRGAMVVAVLAIGAAIAAGTVGTLRLMGRGPGLRWFAVGLLGGAAFAWLR